MTLVRRVLWVVLFLEVGLLLAVVPWSIYWDRNYFTQAVPWLRPAIGNNYVRGAVSGLGIVNLVAAIVDAVSLGRAVKAAWADAVRRAHE